jgi:hypothetical protein
MCVYGKRDIYFRVAGIPIIPLKGHNQNVGVAGSYILDAHLPLFSTHIGQAPVNRLLSVCHQKCIGFRKMLAAQKTVMRGQR